jgi:hypothetical protein
MSGEVSNFSRFFAKFVEIIAAGLASAICAYLLAHFGGLLSSPTPASAPAPTAVQVVPTARGVAGQPIPPVTTAAANEPPVPQQDAPEAKLAPKAGKNAKALPPRKHTKTDTTEVEQEPRSKKSAEAQARAALANVDAKRGTPADAPIGSGLTDTRSVPVDDLPPRQASVPPQPDIGARRVDVPPRPAVEAAPKRADVPLQPVQPSPAPGADLRPRSPDIRATTPSASPPLDVAAPRPLPPADQDKDVFSALKRIPDLLRPDPPAADREPPRPPMPVDTAPPEYGN